MPNAGKCTFLFLADVHEGNIWTAAAGEIKGEMTSPWLGIPPGHGVRRLRFGEFCRFERGRIAEIRCLYDILVQSPLKIFEFVGKRRMNTVF